MKILTIIAGCLLAAGVYSCTKQEQGYLSDRLFYRQTPFPAIKGRVTTSVPLEVDGSTQPLDVKLLAVRGAAGKNIDALTKEYEIAVQGRNKSYRYHP